ncbi:MAG: DUF4256 domain-containing protein [Porphyromonadaceae bacterium]|jgi:hypothetical protein|nr:DUF4256 domain-containing protein [Porphyromonadaceae bacterium]
MKKSLPIEQVEILFKILQTHFEKNKNRHPNLNWEKVKEKLQNNPDKLWSINEMEGSGGEPDVLEFDKNLESYVFVDCSPESPKGRRSLCYDQQALLSRKEHKPKNSAISMAEEMGIDILDEAQYRFLQQFGSFDLKTSSWLLTPEKIRNLGGAIFGDRRYDTVFTYHNGAESYYAARGFRGMLEV